MRHAGLSASAELLVINCSTVSYELIEIFRFQMSLRPRTGNLYLSGKVAINGQVMFTLRAVFYIHL